MTARSGAMLAVAALAVAACGSDSDRGDAGGPVAPAAGTTTERSPQHDRPGRTEQSARKRQATPKQKSDGSVPPEQRTGTPPAYEPGKPVAKDRLTAAQRQVWEQSRDLCERLGISGLRREHRIRAADPRGVAEALAGRTYQRQARAAVYAGCLAGLRGGD